MKNRCLKNICNSNFITSALKYCICIYCFSLLPFDFLAFVTGTAFAQSDKLVEYVLPQSISDPNDSGEKLMRQLRSADIAPLTEKEEPKQQNELKRLIEQVRAIEVSPQEKTAEQITPDTAVVTEPNEAPRVKDKPEVQKKDFQPQLPYTPISEQTMQVLRGLSENPQKIDNPFELGEVLFHNGNYIEAVLFYKEALSRTSLNSPNSAAERAWILFQLGNCLRKNDMTEAAKMYSRLVTEYPDSLWAQMAMIQNQLITWYQKDNPQKLIEDSKQKISE
ncbi:MAG: tetratricopeptide repeat protein [Sedimentisphaerales bacterium]|nr:tetratricopeptide repeat protein [Sedimentisphaerales bacterium]